jgi:antitoxin HicB
MNQITKPIDYYLSLPYTIEVIPSRDGGFVAYIKELPGCITQADTWHDLIDVVQEAKLAWLESALEHGGDIPEPASMSAL